jgi:hypothetical protein
MHHFLGGLAREGEKEDGAGIDSLLHKVGDTKDQSARLTGSSTRNDKVGTVQMSYSVQLSRIEQFLVVDASRDGSFEGVLGNIHHLRFPFRLALNFGTAT